MSSQNDPARPAELHRVPVDGGELHVEVRGDGPALVLHAAPMTAAAFVPLAEALRDTHRVITMDPRGLGRSRVDDATRDVDPDTRADDVAAVIEALDAGPATVLGSSGGAVSALSIAARHPSVVAAVVAHEPPLAVLLDDRDEIRADTELMIATYRSGDRIGYWRRFLASAGIELPDEVFDEHFARPPTGRDLDDERFAVEHMERATTFWDPPLAALAASDVAIVVGIGAASAGQFCDRTSRALGEALDLEPVVFPGGHTGFAEDPADFADVLRTALAGATS